MQINLLICPFADLPIWRFDLIFYFLPIQKNVLPLRPEILRETI
ncbi:hypothetical protein CAPSP0001_1019 [Capnocytophaga sputigena ATCC 33612]|uniref:Uncharacterized protein n=1 Tax=Capnocytophaga sputigena TaxID=1019 RepID=A0AAX2IA81_CAPSP|nr:hypothetical protein CAPSP0001_1019 [Capnocytophaga sputigena ATCC 33612]SQA75054.1 Uncharacterised protein [Capnocytophaga sputigena]